MGGPAKRCPVCPAGLGKRAARLVGACRDGEFLAALPGCRESCYTRLRVANVEEHNLLIVSDLHLSEGLDAERGRYSRLEDFLFDGCFARFLRHHEQVRRQPRFGGRPWLLLVNGDMFDFLQVVSLPEDGRLLEHVSGVQQRSGLSINEQDFGLGTTARESAWKLSRIARGHQRFFAALGWFVAHGNHVGIIKGNHDLELHWPEVQERLVTEVRRAYTRRRLALGEGPEVEAEAIRWRIHFYPWFYYEPNRVYVEHGGQYEPLNHVPDYVAPVLPDDPQRIDLPLGGMAVRYLFNRIEDVHPFVDNIKPATRYLVWALRSKPLETLWLLLRRGWVFVRAFWNIGRKTVRSATKTGRRSASMPLSSPGPAGLPAQVTSQIAALAHREAGTFLKAWLPIGIEGGLTFLLALLVLVFVLLGGVTLATGAGWIAAAYFATAAAAYVLRLGMARALADVTAKGYLLPAAIELDRILARTHPVRYIAMGHDHCARLERLEHGWYVNTGAWVSLYEEQGPMRGEQKLTFARVVAGKEGPPDLLYWDDAAGEPARLVIRADAL
jgi:UDP-2,3-diacylglucosamine pyrophosphatase LpxH